MRKNYDAIVIGTSLSGLISGALLAKRGLQVLVVNQEQIPWSFPYGGFSIQRESLRGQGFKRYLFETIFEELDIRPHERNLFERARPSFQVVLPKHRIDITGNREHLLQEYKREFPENIDAIQQFYNTLDGYWEKTREKFSHDILKQPFKKNKSPKHLSPEQGNETLEDLFKQLQLPKTFQQTILAQICFLSHLHTKNPKVAHAAQVLCGGNRKDYYFLSEPKELAEIFFQRITAAGGSVRNDAYVEKLLTDKKKITGARLNSYEGVVHAPIYIGNMEIHRLYDLLTTFKRPRSLVKKLEHVQPNYAKCVFFMGIQEEVIPIGMDEKVIMVMDENRPLIGDNMVILQTSSNLSGQGKRLLHVTFLLPYPKSNEFDEFHDKISVVTSKVLGHIRWLFPFIKDHLLMILPNFVESDIKQRQFHRSLEKFSLLRGMYNHAFSEGFPNQTRINNLFVTGSEIFPALGFEGETISSLNTANLAFQNFQNLEL